PPSSPLFPYTTLFRSALGLRGDGEAHHRLGEVELRQLELPLGVEEQVAGGRLLQLGDRADVACAELLRLLVLLPLEREQLADPRSEEHTSELQSLAYL